jgi:hypothetical protein
VRARIELTTESTRRTVIMANPKLFIGSSKEGVPVARLVANRLESDGCADVTIWDEGLMTRRSRSGFAGEKCS